MMRSDKYKTVLFAVNLIFAFSSAFGKWNYSEQNLADFDSKLQSLQSEIEANGVTAELEPFFLEVGEYGFRRWLSSGGNAERNTRDVISKYNDTYLEIIVAPDFRNDVVTNVASRLLSATNPDSLTENDIRRLVDDGKSKDLAIYGITKHLGLYEEQVENMVAKAFIEEPEDGLGLAVSLGLDAAAPFMLEAVSNPFDPKSLTTETSLITTINESGDVIQENQLIYGFVRNGSAESIRRAAEWLLNTGKDYPEVARLLSLRLQEIDSFLPEGAMPQFKGLLLSATTAVEVPSTPPAQEVEEVAQESTAPEPATEKPADVKTSDTSKESTEQTSKWSFWLIGLLIVVSGIALAARRKN